MVEPAPIALDAFNGKLFFATAWGFDRADVETFINQVVENPADYGVQPRWAAVPGPIQNYIGQLKPGAQTSASYFPDPPQYLFRQDLGLPPDPPPPLTLRLDPKAVRNYQVCSMCDFMGFFLSLAPAPDTADRDNFFAPWLVIYWKWLLLFQATQEEKDRSTQLNPDLNWGKLIKNPSMLQATWRITTKQNQDNQDVKEIVFHMGASLGYYAYVGLKGQYGPYKTMKNNWSQSIMRFRFNMLANPDGSINGRWQWTQAPEYTLTDTQRRKARGDRDKEEKKLANLEKSGWDFGNCAETYPFLEIFGDGGQTSGTEYRGVAIKRDSMKAVLAGELADYERPTITEPCRNCQYLLVHKYHAELINFWPPGLPLPAFVPPV